MSLQPSSNESKNHAALPPKPKPPKQTKLRQLQEKGSFSRASKRELATVLFREPEDVPVRILLNAIRDGASDAEACAIASIHPDLLTMWLTSAQERDPDPLYVTFRHGYMNALLEREQRTQARVPLIQGFDVSRLLTPARLDELFTYMERGVFPSVAVEAVGIPASVFYEVISLGKNTPDGPYHDIYLRFITMQARARVGAEMRVYEESPLAWLLHGPGRDRPESPGWTRQSSITGANGGAIDVVVTQWGAEKPRIVESQPFLVQMNDHE